jgi:putative ABC transport system substrate-binding protein
MFAAGALAPGLLLAQKKMPRVGMLGTGSWKTSPHISEGFKRRMQELGWTEGRDIEYVLVDADGYVDRLDAIARGLVEQKVDVIVAGPPPSAVAAAKATRTIPIVMGNVPDPVDLGLVASLARPGGNVTGVSSQTTALVAKEIELLKQILPGAKRMGVLLNEKNPNAAAFRESAEKAGATAGVALSFAVANRPEELAAAVQRLAKEGVQAIAVPADPMMLNARRALNGLLSDARLPAAFGNRDHAVEGALVSYAPNIVQNFRIAAGYVNRILRGADPAQLPVEQSNTIELVLNLKTAKALGIAIPTQVRVRADEVIE